MINDEIDIVPIEPKSVPKPNTIKGSWSKVRSGRYKVKYGAKMDTSRLDIELEAKIDYIEYS